MKTKSRGRCKLNVGRWAAYAAAGAVTALAASNDAEATIYYSGVRDIPGSAAQPTDRITTLGTHHHSGPPGIGSQTIAQFGSAGSFAHLSIVGVNAGHAPLKQRFVGVTASNGSGEFGYAGKYAAGASIAGKPLIASAPLDNLVSLSFKSSYKNGGHGKWHPAGVGFLLFEFNRGGGEQYGWARIDMLSGPPHNTFEVVDWAFGSIGQAITAGEAPEPASLGLLALGAVGLLAARASRKRAAV